MFRAKFFVTKFNSILGKMSNTFFSELLSREEVLYATGKNRKNMFNISVNISVTLCHRMVYGTVFVSD